jgi:hypothetical protein
VLAQLAQRQHHAQDCIGNEPIRDDAMTSGDPWGGEVEAAIPGHFDPALPAAVERAVERWGERLVRHEAPARHSHSETQDATSQPRQAA